jgi:hypothetical protein
MVENNLPITKANLEVVATIKNECTKHRIPLEIGLAYYLETAKIEARIKGIDLYSHLLKVTQRRPHRTTIQRWFDGYSPEKIYSTSEVSKILLNAFLYNLRSKHNESKSEHFKRSKPLCSC